MTVALMVAAFVGLAPDPDPQLEDLWSRESLLVGLLVVGLGLAYEAIRDLHEFCFSTFLLGVTAATLAGVVAVFGSEPHLAATAISLGSAAIAATCALYVLRNRCARDPFAVSLRSRHPRRRVRETGGVQFALTPSGRVVLSGQNPVLKITMQNCWDTERTVEITLVDKIIRLRNQPRLLYGKSHEVLLGGAVVGTLHIPVLVQPGCQGQFPIEVRPRVRGVGGVRVRRWRAPIYTRISAIWMALLYQVSPLLFVPFDPGFQFAIRVPARPMPPPTDREPPKAIWMVEYEPDPEELREAAGG